MDNILEIQSLCKNYKDFKLNNLSFSLNRGYIMGFIGPNGAGKSTTIKLIMNLIRKDSGSIKVFGLDNERSEREIKDRIGFVYDENYFYEELTCESMKNIIAQFYSKWDEKVFQGYIKQFEIPLSKKIKELSKGMKMKFSLTIALAHNAEFIIMDEPTSGLDPIFRSEILDVLCDVMQDEQKAIFFSTHITTDLDKIADYITFINNGELVLSCEKDELLDVYGIVKGGKELLDNDIRKEFIGLRENSYGFEGLVKSSDKAKRLFKERAIIEKPSLEDIMLYTVRGNKNA